MTSFFRTRQAGKKDQCFRIGLFYYKVADSVPSRYAAALEYMIRKYKEDRCNASVFFYGAGDEARTRYLHLGKVALYRMSYTRNGHDVL